MQKAAQSSYETGKFVLYTRSLVFCLAKELSPFTILTSIKLLTLDKGYYRHRYSNFFLPDVFYTKWSFLVLREPKRLVSRMQSGVVHSFGMPIKPIGFLASMRYREGLLTCFFFFS